VSTACTKLEGLRILPPSIGRMWNTRTYEYVSDRRAMLGVRGVTERARGGTILTHGLVETTVKLSKAIRLTGCEGL
jgi:hypothetical protein